MNWQKLFGKKRDPQVEKMMREASTLGRSRFLEQQILAIAPLSNVEGADEILDNPQDMLAVELPFMWGWFMAFAEDQVAWPTTPDQRATMHLIWYCMDHHEMNFDDARAEGVSMDQLWNEADPVFEALHERGRDLYQDPNRAILASVIEHVAKHRRGAP